MRWLCERLFGEKLEARTAAYLDGLVTTRTDATRDSARRLVRNLAGTSAPTLVMGNTEADEAVRMPINDFLRSHALVSGASGSGKTTFVLDKQKALLDGAAGFGILDPKADLVNGCLYLIGGRLADLERTKVRDLRRRIVFLDFSSRDPISPYNIFARWPGADPDFFAGSRTDLLLELLPGADGVSLGASALLRRAILLLSEFNLPITWLDNLLRDEHLRARLVGRSKNAGVAAYFTQHFPNLPRQTVAALSRRMEALFSSETVRLVLAGTSAPDFRALQDQGKIVIVNCFGRDINRSVRQLLQALVLSDVAHATFARRNHGTPFLWMADEAQNLFGTQHLRDHMMDLLTMARSFGTHLMLISQNMTTALQDARTLSVLHTNIRWAFAMRGEPADCAFLRSALPVTGRRPKPRTHPFEEPGFYSINEERGMVQDEIANLPDRVGYLWFKSRSQEALRVRTPELVLPHGDEFQAMTDPLRHDPTFGARLSRKEHDQRVAARDAEWLGSLATETIDLGATLAGAYRRKRGGEA
ncbi:MAG TPA: hypothetical protein VN822_10470 [Candidatus Acidoferrales bacterium]|nr:hypothetical protein [Candidatus Acidoferrales bacterium]HYW46408.1 hypothetical protein [Bryobacteraceae bacterium]